MVCAEVVGITFSSELLSMVRVPSMISAFTFSYSSTVKVLSHQESAAVGRPM